MSLNTNFDSSGNVIAKNNRPLAGGLAIAGAAGLGFAALSHSWLTMGSLDGGIGLLGVEVCGRGRCQSASLSEVVDKANSFQSGSANGFFPIAGYIAFALCLIAAIVFVATAISAFKKDIKLPLSPAKLALPISFLALIAGCIFVATKPGGSRAGFGVGAGFMIFGVAAVVGMVGGILLRKQEQSEQTPPTV